MKKALLIFLVLGPFLINAQSFIDTSKVWHVVECLNQGGCGTSVIRFGSDTTIGVYQYKNLIVDSGHTHLLGSPFAAREDTVAKRVYFYEGTMEYLAYDFSLNKGDTVTVRCSVPMTVDSVDTVSLLNGELRKRMFLSVYDEIWIEGIGSLFGLPYPGIYFCAFDISVELNCFKENDTLKYQHAFYPDCYYNTLSVQEINTGWRFRSM